jgi:predicted RNA-binding protein YlxR (DUF448 family)
VGCGSIRPQAELVRYTRAGERAVPDRERAAPGRGAYLCPGSQCLEQARSRRAFARAFRAPVSLIDPELESV